MVMSRAYAMSRDEIVRALTAYAGVTTADGAVTRDSLIDAALIGATDWITEKTILIDTGPSERQDKGAASFNPANGEITFISPCTNRIMAATMYRILNISSTELDVALLLARMGTNTDPAGTTTLFAWFARLWAFLGSTSGSLWYAGTVTAIPGANQFRIPTLAGLGSGQFIAGAVPWRAFVKKDAVGTGLAPQGQNQDITAYATGAGDFTTVPFAPAVDVGDEILILHPSLAIILDGPAFMVAITATAALIQARTDLLAGLPGTNGNLAAAWGDGAEHDLVTIGAPLLREKLHLLIIGIANLVGNISIRLYTDVNGTERRIYPIPAVMTFNRVNDAPAIPVVNSTMGLRNALRVTIQSDNAADNAQIVEYEYLREAM